MITDQLKKLFFISASTLSALCLIAAAPSAVVAQEMELEDTTEVEAVETVDFERDEEQLGQSFEEDTEFESDMDSDVDYDYDSDDVDYDYDSDDDDDITPTYSNSPRALW